MKAEVKRRKTTEMHHLMGTGGGPALRTVEDPITAQVENIVPHLDVVIDTEFDTDHHHRVAASRFITFHIFPSSTKFLSLPLLFSQSFSFLYFQSSISPSRPYFLTIPRTPPPSLPIRKPHLPADSHAAASGSAPSTTPSSSARCQRRRAQHLVLMNQELKARLAVIEEERIQQRALQEARMNGLQVELHMKEELHLEAMEFQRERTRVMHLKREEFERKCRSSL